MVSAGLLSLQTMLLNIRRWPSRYRSRVLQVFVLLLICASLLIVYTATYTDGILWTSSQAPPPELVTPDSRDVPLALVLGKTRKESVKWAYEMYPEWTPFVYTMENEPGFGLHVPANRGREAMAYLTFIIDHYTTLPEITAFVHATHYQWHNEDISPYTSRVLRRLRLETVRTRGYVNLRCNVVPGCNPTSVHPHSPTEVDVQKNDVRAQFRDIYVRLFGLRGVQEVPEALGGVCCAQFVVTREKILQRPVGDYVRMREWVLMESGGSGLSDFDVGWVFEKVWHVVFGEGAIFCPTTEKCLCDVYGKC